ncbi:MAG: F0F1 ATP synthase subunit delta [Clostridiales bacterium]|jgi:F-type H+-transporting ATPase subunit delta|nr:F0F1 ATP synthase subunit delta [Clostridiales bacterium]
MMEQVSKLYADALFELSKDENCVNLVYDKINKYREVLVEHKDLQKLLSVPTIPLADKLNILSKFFKNDSIAYNFLCVLVEKKRLNYFESIVDEYNKNYNSFNNIIEITATTSVPLTDETRQKLIDKLSKKFDKKVKLIEVVSPEILGGIIIRYGNTQIDNSIRGKLKDITKQLKQA